MSRKLLALSAILSAALLMFTVPALARTHRGANRHKSLVMGGRIGARKVGRLHIASVIYQGVVDNQGFKCQVPVGTGPSDTHYVSKTTFDSVEYSVEGGGTTSVSTVCIGQLPSSTTVAPTIVSAPLTNCRQLDPARPGQTIKGGGVITTFPDHLYLASCTTPNYS